MESVQQVDPVLIRKYNKPVPRYTSYPTVPYWKDGFSPADWELNFEKEFNERNYKEGISIYIHLPFCESLCTYCGCNKKITTNHRVEEEYIEAITKEWKLYRNRMQQTPVIREIHVGGGTPTFFSPANLRRLLTIILNNTILHPGYEFSIEGHPGNTSKEHLETLYQLGFRRISYGVQDNDPEVQRVINRIQPFEQVKLATETARAIGFESVNFDLVYGLPKQTPESITRTINEVMTLRPDRIAFYSYAHVPWTSKAQRLFDEHDLPDAATKLNLYLKGKDMLTSHGYIDIGMDHFSLPHDALYKAWAKGKLHRNFMGYTVQHAGLLIGLGVSAISDTGTAYAQNDKTLHNYYALVNQGILPTRKGYMLSEEDKLFKQNILDISCTGATRFADAQQAMLEQYTFPLLDDFVKDGLLTYDRSGLQLSSQGRYFIRNVCSAFDMFLHRQENASQTPVFSNAI